MKDRSPNMFCAACEAPGPRETVRCVGDSKAGPVESGFIAGLAGTSTTNGLQAEFEWGVCIQ